ncbi:lysine decarboxylase [Desulfitispora alkaliphila]|uniref:aminotransferase class I/II-fold pyridoxal phosphate-dependent enzyme n=1 Tax=Desulfitispora alkaliphila TaxID=622674 RepID=UPI003D1FFC36
MSTPLINAIENHLKKYMTSFHTPGHKGRMMGTRKLWGIMKDYGLGVDLTEVAGLDELAEPTGAIAEAEKLAARLFNSRDTAFLVNGASSGLIASILTCVKPGEKILVPRNIHRSVYSAMVLAGVEPVYIRPEVCSGWNMPLPIEGKTYIEAMDRENPKAIIVVNPTYDGLVGPDLGEAIKFARKQGIATIVDEAHGTFFPFSKKLPESGLELGADLIIHGMHKTFGSLTQTGLLHIGRKSKISFSGIKRALSLVQSTSPSYILMASIDGARSEFENGGREGLKDLIDKCEKTNHIIGTNKGFDTLYKEINSDENKHNSRVDPTKIAVKASDIGFNGFTLSRLFRENYGIESEMAQDQYCLLLAGIGTNDADLEIVLKACEKISKAKKQKLQKSSCDYIISLPELPPREYMPRESYYSNGEVVPLKRAEGRISKQLVCPYPPGVPILYPGERVTEDIIAYIERQLEYGATVQGLERDGNKSMGLEVIEN